MKSIYSMYIGQPIFFMLDNHVSGEGTFVTTTGNKRIVVKLTKPCKEFASGTEIIIGQNEIVTDENKGLKLIEAAIEAGSNSARENDQGVDANEIRLAQLKAHQTFHALLAYVKELENRT